MNVPPVDLDAIVASFAGEQPAGVDVRADAATSANYHELRDARAAARAVERRAMYESEEGSANALEAMQAWRRVAAQAMQLLGGVSKDLEVAAWLSEALLRLQGFPGLRDGFRIIAGLVETHWENLHPQPDEDGLQRRLAAIAGLNGEGMEGTLVAPIRMAPLVPTEAGAFALWHYERAARIERLTSASAREAALNEAGFCLETVATAARALPRGRGSEIHAAVVDAHAAVEAAGAALDHAAGEAAPSLRQILNVLEEVREACCYLGLAPENDVFDAEEEGPSVGAAQAARDDCPAKQHRYASREAAISEILRIAAYLRRVEPHSPISYTLEEAVRRARLPLMDLLPELIPDREARRLFLLAAGIGPVDDGE
ncbi:MAG: type VI secretion system protein TssA [Chelatococcus sp.]|jgi:type VI secretion system protein ImpA|uniref:type VI secretion system protein TssA n=1 Tax=unclassified Chelatococcus TaxID=2638111 RepID=UPI001BCBC285|nr:MULTISPECIES: type VI secretion system protein TssA [unclassified Chelatococcus]CAH1653481.1 Type VI secretion system protein ImpA [Hyphomicrobiales bacterium]MBS7740125.1 type VI secretion system protein TssA [Chelatococcus sp. HY11]MBX3538646.1 type VI secretion system protein TssA [Chelatococcus sp.]MBX3545046.1 type VI secretion system protein TssA [Chelatococcus sp.]MCO5078575.1 type VI secretion system protein TssA [Chelatococcus sp.]